MDSNIPEEYVGFWEKQVCLRDALIDALVRQVDIWKEVAIAETNMSEVLRKELEKALDDGPWFPKHEG